LALQVMNCKQKQTPKGASVSLVGPSELPAMIDKTTYDGLSVDGKRGFAAGLSDSIEALALREAGCPDSAIHLYRRIDDRAQTLKEWVSGH
jgi:hypothetical protein